MTYEIKGGAMPVVECQLNPGEAMDCEGGSMVWMRDGISMETKGGGIGKMFSKFLSDEKIFSNIYRASKPSMIAFGSSYMGSITAHEIGPGKEIICQSSAYLAATEGVERSVHFQENIGGGFFGGEGFIMQRIHGQGTVFLEIDGTAIEHTLEAGETMTVDTGHLAVMDATCSLKVEMVKGLKNIVFGGEGLFNTIITGPGKIVLQTMPKNSLVSSIAPFLPNKDD